MFHKAPSKNEIVKKGWVGITIETGLRSFSNNIEEGGISFVNDALLWKIDTMNVMTWRKFLPKILSL